MLLEQVKKYTENLKERFAEISDDRKIILCELSDYVSSKLKKNEDVNLIFICTHNSRRSHMAQIWAQTSAEYYSIDKIKCYSGGTEATEFNANAIKAVSDAGFKVIRKDESKNPLYLVYFSEDKYPVEAYSKVYYYEKNPQKDFAAIITCSDADQNCPVVLGSIARFSLRYDDPKEYDGTDLESEKYMERFAQIGTELLFAFREIKKLIS